MNTGLTMAVKVITCLLMVAIHHQAHSVQLTRTLEPPHAVTSLPGRHHTLDLKLEEVTNRPEPISDLLRHEELFTDQPKPFQPKPFQPKAFQPKAFRGVSGVSEEPFEYSGDVSNTPVLRVGPALTTTNVIESSPLNPPPIVAAATAYERTSPSPPPNDAPEFDFKMCFKKGSGCKKMINNLVLDCVSELPLSGVPHDMSYYGGKSVCPMLPSNCIVRYLNGSLLRFIVVPLMVNKKSFCFNRLPAHLFVPHIGGIPNHGPGFSIYNTTVSRPCYLHFVVSGSGRVVNTGVLVSEIPTESLLEEFSLSDMCNKLAQRKDMVFVPKPSVTMWRIVIPTVLGLFCGLLFIMCILVSIRRVTRRCVGMRYYTPPSTYYPEELEVVTTKPTTHSE